MIPIRRSLLAQVVLLHLATAIIAAILLPFAVSSMLRKTANHYEHGILTAQTRTLSKLLAARYDAATCRGTWPDTPTPSSGQEGLSFIVSDSAGHVMIRSGSPRPDVESVAPHAKRPRFFRVGPLEGLSTPIGTAPCAWIVMSQDTRAPQFVSDDIVGTFLGQFAALVIPLLFLVPVVGAFLMGMMIRRMKQVVDIATSIGPRNPDIRLPIDRLPAEVAPLASATNRALDRLADGLRAQTEFASNVAHELRTPLTLMRLKLQSLEASSDRQQLLDAVDRASRVVTQLLALVELERPAVHGMIFRPKEVVEASIVERAPYILSGGRKIGLADGGEKALRFGQPEMLGMALENLLDNAVHHTPPGTNIWVSVGEDGSVSVEDDGPGIAAEHIDSIAKRFWQADRQGSSGVGIGLSIVSRIASAYGGTLDIGMPANGKGIRFTLLT